MLLTTGCAAAIDLPLKDDPLGHKIHSIGNVEYGFDFLLDMHRGTPKAVGKRVAVVGAGFTALDCARVARRLGGEEVTIHIRTGEEYIPVTKEEIFEAKREDVRLLGLRTPVDIRTDEDGHSPPSVRPEPPRRLARQRPAQGRSPSTARNSISSATRSSSPSARRPCTTSSTSRSSSTAGTMPPSTRAATSVEGVFAAGDYVRSASTVIEAIGHAREVAKGVDTWLMGRERRRRMVRVTPVEAPLRERSFDFITPQHMPTAELAPRCKAIDREVELGYDDPPRHEESKRCYLCNLSYQIGPDNCIFCRACIDVAPKNCIDGRGRRHQQ
ncbi:MAG: FAD-dependent oxidoreductase [Hyphomicrobiales bacterium]